jgi:hypothetical protein
MEFETSAVPKWKIGLWIWREEGEWRLRLYRPWKHERLIEVQSKHFPTALYVLGVGARWWEMNHETPKAP